MNPGPGRAERMRVFLTVDVEYAGMGEIGTPGGADIPPASMDCVSGGKPYGLPYIVETFARHGLKATFFVEPFSHFRFGEKALARTVSLLLGAGQDVQLHLHPCWLFFRDGRKRSDNLFDHSEEEQAGLLALGKEILEGLGARVRAFRAGGFAADDRLYPALRKAGIPWSSSYCQAFRGAGCRLSAEGRNDVHAAGPGTWEWPLTSYRIRDPRRLLGFAEKPFQINCTGAGNAGRILSQAREGGLSGVSVLLHNFEFVDTAKPGWYRRPLAIKPAVTRSFESICSLLAAKDGGWELGTFGDLPSEGPGGPRKDAERDFTPRLNRIYLPL
jgi:hypothetical protein